jgi:hypothetical protein
MKQNCQESESFAFPDDKIRLFTVFGWAYMKAKEMKWEDWERRFGCMMEG